MLHNLGIDLPLLIVQVFGFIILLILLNKFVYKPIFGILEERQQDIKNTYDKLDQDRAEMEKIRRDYEQRLAGIEAQAREQIQAAVKEAQELRAGIISDAHKQAEALIEKGRGESERERQKAFLEMRQQIADLAILAAGKVVGESLDAQRHRRLVDDFIASVGTGTTAPRPGGNGAAQPGAGGAA
ncbi:MAG TPA: F0F1 ATP synthase subunit B [Capsulimonadaceae bacterium]|nr:F0F1 ATP synthase subunit B [Capsulimonadaceae bacterium]